MSLSLYFIYVYLLFLLYHFWDSQIVIFNTTLILILWKIHNIPSQTGGTRHFQAFKVQKTRGTVHSMISNSTVNSEKNLQVKKRPSN